MLVTALLNLAASLILHRRRQMLLGPLVAPVSGGEAAAKTPREAKPSRKLAPRGCLFNFTWHQEGSFETHRLGIKVGAAEIRREKSAVAAAPPPSFGL